MRRWQSMPEFRIGGIELGLAALPLWWCKIELGWCPSFAWSGVLSWASALPPVGTLVELGFAAPFFASELSSAQPLFVMACLLIELGIAALRDGVRCVELGTAAPHRCLPH